MMLDCYADHQPTTQCPHVRGHHRHKSPFRLRVCRELLIRDVEEGGLRK